MTILTGLQVSAKMPPNPVVTGATSTLNHEVPPRAASACDKQVLPPENVAKLSVTLAFAAERVTIEISLALGS